VIETDTDRCPELPDRHMFSVSYRYSRRGYPDIVLCNNPKTVIGTREVECTE